jgi:hypothetical protein
MEITYILALAMAGVAALISSVMTYKFFRLLKAPMELCLTLPILSAFATVFAIIAAVKS